ncbi:MAG: hypothetical protein KJZ87_29130 [Thermoguttaceae bacterium]|nr:hypothetical protein [Thermoguttaceae bacterium]
MPAKVPSGDGGSGRDCCTGRFAPGNKLGRGSPLAGRAAKLRAALLASVSDDDIREIAAMLVQKAKEGDLPAIAQLLDRVLGKPTASDLMERVEKLEETLLRREQ